ncbi:iron ABC transporter permease [Oleiphilus sp. HI0009]|uniref:ABC transporter permease n=2 Tax=Oleiphilus TaxID=141450 RepID=UPI0007C30346|nr:MULTISPECIES: iron ABC transporter permease [unclassified Oleiphilus]KZX82378.1 iron ABC transporter permease [Oleiphilus sp. HI0009]KZY64330.1 iron ABC transporter permease [Oleiphilus sp. HI0066]KZY74443.1 iron ABC transporter permease [Oleiphilus sp. HI0067]MCH2159729.1 iron ABC transporter permease [Oleiphilaceae bacterium]
MRTNSPTYPVKSFWRSEHYWKLSAFLTTSIICLPVLAVLYLAAFPDDNIWVHLSETVLPAYIKSTLILMLGVGCLSTALGIGAAWLISHYSFPGKRFFTWALLLPFAMPAYVIAYVYTDFLEYAGPLQSMLREIFGWQSSRDYYFPEVRSMGGAIILMSLTLYPYIYMLARAAFLQQSVSLYYAARSLGSNSFGFFFRVSLPIARPAIVVGLSLVLMETLNDFGTVDYFAIQTLTAGLYDTWLNMSNLGGAAQIATVMMLAVVFLIMMERKSRDQQQSFSSKTQSRPLPTQHLTGKKAFFATLLASTPIVFGFLIPVIILSDYSIHYFDKSWNTQFFTYAFNSFSLSFSAAFITLVIACILAYTKRLDNSKFTRSMTQVSSLGYAIPGAVLAIGVIIPLAGFDNWLDSIARSHFGFSTGLLLSGSIAALLFAYTVRFLAVATGAIDSSLEKVTPSMDMASRSLGKSSLTTLIRIHLPIIKPGALTAMLVVFVDCMKELPATLILRPFNFETLATHVYQFASDELIEQCALSALVIVIVGIIPVILLSRSINRT